MIFFEASTFNKLEYEWRGRFPIGMHQTSKSNFFNKRSKGLFSLGSGSFHVDKEGYYLALVDLLASLLESNTMRVNSFLNSNSYFHVHTTCNFLRYIYEKNILWYYLNYCMEFRMANILQYNSRNYFNPLWLLLIHVGGSCWTRSE